MKKLFITALAILLTACVDSRGYALQDQFCSDKGGIYEYVTDTGGFSQGWCNDNTKFTYDTVRSIKLQPKFYPEKGD